MAEAAENSELSALKMENEQFECSAAVNDSLPNNVEITDKDAQPTTETPNCSTADTPKECVPFKVVFNKQKFDVEFDLDKTISQVKSSIEKIIGVPATMQKIMFKGLARDDMTLRELKVTKGAKMLVVGSTLTDVLSVSTPTGEDKDETKEAATSKEPLSQQKVHKKVLEKYNKPEDVLPGFQGKKYPLPSQPISGMYNKSGGKVRLTFKLELDQLWIGTKERTDKIPMNTIKAVVTEALEGHEDYHIMGIQLGTTEASRYWVYWVPAQYVDAIKDAILGKWQYF
ncbi:ubiquitin domain-containing protein UBFD1 isoform X1 [Octopus bimaculoides]|uniref:Ubiquitin-like domain-containing protein n=2 Tax=Octopus bimaculoides TaxID=37653 RepID=A0A0L8FZ30_OCTBM|nr:ubiquitin domain-containing protein UBFD1 isoform X1 [Octopus bimaculoides]|eukprot:XP_014785569.1 PREDICTED: ubiquitin domain-containing protein UBFD1-like isoform X1 [Octopus bimaculoides]